MAQPLLGSHLFLIGSEATDAMSPSLWNPVLDELGTGWRYDGWDVPADSDMKNVHSRLLGADVVGANITMPHKHWAAGVADTVSDSVRLSGAANVLLRHGGTLEGHNTDVTAVRSALGDRRERFVVMMGAGGAARAALGALHGRADHVTIADRNPQAADELLAVARELGIPGRTRPWAVAQAEARQSSLIINATPIGKDPSDGPVWGGGALASDAVMYDFVYAPHETASITAARLQGVKCVDGWDHLLEQAVAMVPLLGLRPEAADCLAKELDRIKAHG